MFFAVYFVRLSLLKVLNQMRLDLLFHLEDVPLLIHKALWVLWDVEDSHIFYPPWGHPHLAEKKTLNFLKGALNCLWETAHRRRLRNTDGICIMIKVQEIQALPEDIHS